MPFVHGHVTNVYFGALVIFRFLFGKGLWFGCFKTDGGFGAGHHSFLNLKKSIAETNPPSENTTLSTTLLPSLMKTLTLTSLSSTVDRRYYKGMKEFSNQRHYILFLDIQIKTQITRVVVEIKYLCGNVIVQLRSGLLKGFQKQRKSFLIAENFLSFNC